jgi:hypothetical protein
MSEVLMVLGAMLGPVWVGVVILTIKDALRERRHPQPLEPDGLGESMLRLPRWDEISARPARILLVPVVIALDIVVVVLFLPLIVAVGILRMLPQSDKSPKGKSET